MQLGIANAARGRIAAALLTATSSLLGVAPGAAVAQEEPKLWEFDTALLYYSESDSRVSDISGSVQARRSLRNGSLISFGLTIDSLTGASPSGAIRTNGVQTFTSPSGNKTYTTPAGSTPLDPTFLDTRIALTANWRTKPTRKGTLDVGLSASNEYDYLHLGLSARYAYDLGRRNDTISFGLSVAQDSIDPVGGTPIPLSAMLLPGDLSNRAGTDDKTVIDALLGYSHVFGRRTVGQLNYSFTRSSGYLNDPYKIVSVLDGETGELVPGPGDLGTYLFESRPDSRTQHALYAEVRHSLGRDVLGASYRIATDDWGIDSHTVDLRYRWFFRPSWYVQPHVRYYMQSAADFYTLYLVDDRALPQNASADYRLAEFDAITVGAKIGFRPGGSGRDEWGLRFEYYTQSGVSPPALATGLPAGDDLVPSVDALIVQASYSF